MKDTKSFHHFDGSSCIRLDGKTAIFDDLLRYYKSGIFDGFGDRLIAYRDNEEDAVLMGFCTIEFLETMVSGGDDTLYTVKLVKLYESDIPNQTDPPI